MNKGYLNRTLRIPIRLENANGDDITGATASGIDVNFAYEDDGSFTLLTPTTHYTLDELSKGQYWLEINKSQITKTGNVQLVVENDGTCPGMAIKRYSAHVELPSDLVKAITSESFVERSGITSGRITKSGYSDLGALFTSGGDNLDLDLTQLEGAILHYADASATQTKNYMILGGYFFNDTGDTTQKVFGIALNKDKFDISEGGTNTIDTEWTGTDLTEAGHGSGWTFIVADAGADAAFPASGEALDLYLAPAFDRQDALKNIFKDGAIYVDMVDGIDTDALPYGVPGAPLLKLDKGLDLAVAHLIKHLKINQGPGNESINLGPGIRGKYKTFEGLTCPWGTGMGYIEFTGSPPQMLSNVFINLRLKMSGESGGSRFYNCAFVTGWASNDAWAIGCFIEGTIQPTRTWYLERCYFAGGDVNFSGETSNAKLKNCSGKPTIKGINNAGDNVIIDDFEGHLEIDLTTCTAGNLLIRGGKGRISYIGSGGGTTITIEGFIDRFNVMTEDDGGIPRYTANALEEGPIANVSGLLTTAQFNTKIPSNISFTGGWVDSNIKTVAGTPIQETGGYIKAKNEDGAKIGTDANQTTIINHLADIKGSGWITAANLKNIYDDTNEVQGKLPSGTIAQAGDKMDLIDELKHISGSSGFDRTTDSLEAIGAAAAGIVSKATLKDILFNRNVLTRHTGQAAGKPKTIAVGSGGAEGTITTTVDGEYIKQETIA